MIAVQADPGEPIRILSLAPFYPRAAPPVGDQFIHRQMAAVARAGARVLTAAPAPRVPSVLTRIPRWSQHGGAPATEVLGDMEIRFPRYLKLPFRPLHGIATLVAEGGLRRVLDRMVAEFRPHVIHAHAATPWGYVGLRAGRRHGIPLVCSFLGGDIHVYPRTSRLARRLTRRVIVEADGLAANSARLRSDALALAGVQREAAVIHRGCDLDAYRFDPEGRRAVRERLGITEHAPTFVFVGNLSPEKGIPELIEAFSAVRSRHPDARLLLVGRPAKKGELSELLRGSGAESAVDLSGLVSAEVVPAWLSAGDVFVLPSHREGMPNAMLEAMSCERPVVATTVGGIPEVVHEGVGVLVEPRAPEALARALLEMLERRPRWGEMGAEARYIIRRDFDWDRSGEEFLLLYESCIRNRHPA